ILLPDINKSERDFTFFENSIRVGLNSIYELSYKVIDRILQHRKYYGSFKDVFEFLKITNPAKHEAINLAKAGALSSVMPAQPQALAAVNLFFGSKKNVNQARLLLQEVNLRSYSLPQRILYEMEILDFAVSSHPLTLYKDFLPKNAIHSFALLQHKNKTVTIYGWVVTSRRLKTEKGEMMKFITLEDYWGMMEVVFFPETYKQYAPVLHGHGPFVMEAEIQARIPGELNLIAKSVTKIEVKKEELEKVLQ
ncbi:MAG: hypothetical protein KAR38_05140, partial [Calditrichia bacterium]|nr:hypothetical protein [Calditrichia bacterium]